MHGYVHAEMATPHQEARQLYPRCPAGKELQVAIIYAIIDSTQLRRAGIVANLIVRGIDESVVRALKQRAADHGRSAEAEHREILSSVLRRPRKRHLAEVLAAVPHVGHDEDFARVEDAAEARRVPG
jgi:plasmid stability protein